jgi:hypothetical protein
MDKYTYEINFKKDKGPKLILINNNHYVEDGHKDILIFEEEDILKFKSVIEQYKWYKSCLIPTCSKCKNCEMVMETCSHSRLDHYKCEYKGHITIEESNNTMSSCEHFEYNSDELKSIFELGKNIKI